MDVPQQHSRIFEIGWPSWVALFLLGVLSLLSPKPISAQPHAFDQYTVDDGLPSNYVYRIAEDELGYLWAATENGLARFDGYEWRSYGLEDGLTGLDVYEMSRLPSGELIVGGAGFLPMVISHGEVRPIAGLVDIMQDKLCLIVNSYPPLVSQAYSKDTIRYYEVMSSTSFERFPYLYVRRPQWIPEHFLGGFAHNADSAVWERRLAQEFPFYIKNYNDELGAKFIYKGNLFSDEQSINEWLSALGKGARYSREFGYVDEDQVQTWNNLSLYLFDSTYTKESITFEHWSRYFDINVGMRSRSGDYWLATRSSGIIRIPHSAQQVRLLQASGGVSWEGVQRASFGTVVADDQSNLYQYKSGVLKPYEDLHSSHGQSRFRDLSLMPDQGTMLFARDNKMFIIDSLGFRPITNKYGGYNSETALFFYPYDEKALYTNIGPSKSFQANATTLTFPGNYILYTTDSSVVKLGDMQPYYVTLKTSNASRETFHYIDQHRLYELELNSGILATRWQNDTLSLVSALELSDDKFLLGTQRSGVFSLDLSSETPLLRHLIDCGPVKNLKLVDGAFWAATYTGMYRFSESGKIDLHLKKGKGLLTDETYDMDLVGDSILIATANGLAIIDKDLKDPPSELIPNLHVAWRNIWVDGVLRKLENNALELSPGEDNLELSFAVLHPNHDDDIDYEVQLSPIDETPRTQRERTVRYASLSPGQYELSVRAVLADGSSYSLEHPLQIYLAAPLYKRPWFLVLSMLILAAGIYVYVRQRERSKAKLRETQEQALRKTSELQLEALRSQMNPHFIFNALGSIQYFIQTEAKDKADEYLGRFAKLMRGYLDGSKRNLTTVTEEMSLLRQYLELEKMRADNSFSYLLEVDPKLNDLQQFPSMLLQPLVENAVIHGLAARKDGKAFLEVVLKQAEQSLIATVVDNGQGVLKSQKNKRRGHRSRASEIMQARIRALQQAGIAEVSLVYEEANVNGLEDQHLQEQFPGTRVTITVQNISDHD